MNKKVLTILVLLLIVIIIGSYQLIFVQRNAFGGIKIITIPTTNVFLDDVLLGKTPFEDKYKSGEYIVKLIPETATADVVAWQGKIKINPSVLTYVNRELAKSELVSSGEVLTLEKINQTQPQITVASQPDAAIVLLDGQEKGISPITFDVTTGEHDVSVSSIGFVSRTIRVQATTGYKLQINFQLALTDSSAGSVSPDASVSASPAAPSEKKTDKKKVRIKDTPTGFLRVRTEASTSSEEIAQVKPGETYTLLEEKESWYKIAYAQDKQGWISARYAEKEE